MVTMLDCIRRVPQRLDWIAENRENTFARLKETFGARLSDVNEIVLIGSGTSSSSAFTAKFIAERAAKVRVTSMIPTDFLHEMTVYNARALYVYVSQTGTSTMTRVALCKAKKEGFMTVAVSESPDTVLAREADVFVNMGCGGEEYPMRTIGYSTSVLTIVMLAMEVGRASGRLSNAEYEAFLQEAAAASGHIPEVIEKAIAWLDTDRRNMLRADCLMFTGAGALAGVAMEASIKVWETPQITALFYELEEGLHGPNFGYSQRHCVIVLNDGGIENDKAVSLCKFMKYEMGNGFLVGANPVDAHDLAFEPRGGRLSCLEFAAAMQVLCYRLAVDQGRDLVNRGTHGNMGKYFSSHRDVSPAALLDKIEKNRTV